MGQENTEKYGREKTKTRYVKKMGEKESQKKVARRNTLETLDIMVGFYI